MDAVVGSIFAETLCLGYSYPSALLRDLLPTCRFCSGGLLELRRLVPLSDLVMVASQPQRAREIWLAALCLGFAFASSSFAACSLLGCYCYQREGGGCRSGPLQLTAS